jgi:hypothetical protein
MIWDLTMSRPQSPMASGTSAATVPQKFKTEKKPAAKTLQCMSLQKRNLPVHKNGLKTHRIAGATLALAFTFTAQAQNGRSFVATSGDDNNACSASAYCRTFGRALATTISGGEVVVVNSGGYGPFTISNPVTITAIGVDASVTAASGSAITINTTGDVTITGLNLLGGGAGNYGVRALAVINLRLFHMQIQEFAAYGIDFNANGNLDIEDSQISGNATGLLQAAGQGYVHNTVFSGNTAFGASALGTGNLTVADSSAQYNGSVGVYVGSATATLYLHNDRVSFNGVGIEADAGNLYFANCRLAGNTNFSWFVAMGATLASSSPATNLIAPGQTSHGSLAAATVIQ